MLNTHGYILSVTYPVLRTQIPEIISGFWVPIQERKIRTDRKSTRCAFARARLWCASNNLHSLSRPGGSLNQMLATRKPPSNLRGQLVYFPKWTRLPNVKVRNGTGGVDAERVQHL